MRGSRLRAAALLHHHAGHVALDDVGVLVQVYERHGRQLGGRAALREGPSRAVPSQLLEDVGVEVHERVRGAVHAVAGALAVVGLVAPGRDDPVVPAQLVERYEEFLLAAQFRVLVALEGAAGEASRGRGRRVHHQEGAVRGFCPSRPGLVSALVLSGGEQRGLKLATAAAAVHQQPQPLAGAREPPLHQRRQVQTPPSVPRRRHAQRRRELGEGILRESAGLVRRE